MCNSQVHSILCFFRIRHISFCLSTVALSSNRNSHLCSLNASCIWKLLEVGGNLDLNVTDFLEQWRTEQLDSNCCFVPRTFYSRSRHTNASKSIQMQCMAGGKRGCCSGRIQIRLPFSSILVVQSTAESYEIVEEILTVFRWQSDIGHSLAISEIPTAA